MDVKKDVNFEYPRFDETATGFRFDFAVSRRLFDG
jgi:hypothetical protein